ncbi:MAG: zinc-binding dehydrogenase, partial [Pararhodobacter sp.]|nr:zinc-binding dehydrogenase [Pararhodobacter sp.]
DGPIAGQDVLVTGGAGSVGAYAVQMARLGGARRVIATASGGAKSAHAAAMGADAVVNYREGDPAEAILAATEGRGVDRIVEVEFGANLAVTRKVLKQDGIIAAYGSMGAPEPVLPFYPMMFAAQTLRTVLVYSLPPAARAQGIADLTGWLETGALQHPIALTVPLAEGWRAHEACESNARIGAALIEVAEDV